MSLALGVVCATTWPALRPRTQAHTNPNTEWRRRIPKSIRPFAPSLYDSWRRVGALARVLPRSFGAGQAKPKHYRVEIPLELLCTDSAVVLRGIRCACCLCAARPAGSAAFETTI